MSSASAPGQAALGTVLDFLFAANLDASLAFPTAKALIEAGITTREQINQLTPERVKLLAPKATHRKLLSALRKRTLPTLDSSATSPETGKRSKRAPPPPPPPPPPPEAEQLPDVVLNRSPVMIIWATAVAHEVHGLSWPEALSVASACAALFARSKGRALGLHPAAGSASSSTAAEAHVGLLGRLVPCERASDGTLRGLSEHKHRAGCFEPVDPAAVFRSLAGAFADAFGAAWTTFGALALSVPRASLLAHDNRLGFELYTQFRPPVPSGLAGWGAPGRLRLTDVEQLRRNFSSSVGDALPSGTQPPPATRSGLEVVKTDDDEVVAPQVPAQAAKSEDVLLEHPLMPVATARVVTTASASAPDAQALYTEIARCGPAGASVQHLSRAVGVDAAIVRGWIEELQLDGAVYEGSAGAFFVL